MALEVAGLSPRAISQPSGRPSESRSVGGVPWVSAGQPPTSLWELMRSPVRVVTCLRTRRSTLSLRMEAPTRARTLVVEVAVVTAGSSALVKRTGVLRK